jgi:hypothetical protein
MSDQHIDVNEQEKARSFVNAAVILALGITLKLLGKLVED